MGGVTWRTVQEVSPETVLFLLVVAIALAVVWRRKSVPKSRTWKEASKAGAYQDENAFSPPLLPLILFLLFVAIGALRTEVSSWQFDRSQLERQVGSEVRLVGTIVREPDERERSRHLHVQSGEDLILVTTDRLGLFSYGDEVEVSGKLERPKSFETDLGRTFDYPNYLRAKGIEYNISFADVAVLERGHGNVVMSALLTGKHFFLDKLQQVIPEPEVGLGAGLLLGVKSALGDDIEANFRRTGIIHIVVLSGYNVMLVVAFVMFCLSFLFPFRYRVAVGIATIAAFALLVGLSATVVRASVMAILVLLAQVFGRQYNVMRALLLAGLLMVFINPYLLVYDVGFQLSFMATLGLLLIMPKFELMGLAKAKWFGVKEFFLATLATQVAVLPLLMYHIGEVSLISLVVNILVLPIVPVAMLLTFLTGIMAFISAAIAGLLGYAATLTLSYILAVAEWFASLPYAAVTVPEFSAPIAFGLYGVMAMTWFYLERRSLPDESDDFSDWTIETEMAGGLSSQPADSSEVPIYFR